MDNLLAISENYKIINAHETVYLITSKNPHSPYDIVIGDFYGNPEVAIIDHNENWCISAGCGFIVYYLNEPFKSYSYNQINKQYDEYYRDPPNICWIENLQQISDSEILITKEFGEQYIFNIQTKQFTVPNGE